MNTTTNTPNPSENITCLSNSHESAETFIEDLFNEEGAFGEADCAGI